jgi:hypothetical protein
MKIIRTFFLSAFLIISLNAQAQQIVPGSETLLDKLRLNKGISGPKNVLYADIVGNPYIFENFQKGKLILNNGEEYDITLRYDIYANELHIRANGEIYAIIHPEKVKLAEAGDIKFIYSGYTKSPEESSYFIVRTDGKCKLLIKKNIRIQDAEPAKLYQEAKPAKFILTNDTYYLKLEDKSAVRIRNKKEIFSVLGDQKEALNRFISSNNLAFKNVEALDKIVSYYNGL